MANDVLQHTLVYRKNQKVARIEKLEYFSVSPISLLKMFTAEVTGTSMSRCMSSKL